MVVALATLIVVVQCLGLVLVVLSSIPAVVHLVRRPVQRRKSGQQDESLPPSHLYRDGDGEATPASVREFSNQWQRISIAVLSIMGLGVSLAPTILSMRHDGVDNCSFPGWIHLGMWVGSPS